MTETNISNKVSYAGDGATVVFTIPFGFKATSDIQAILRDANAAETVWVEGTQYTLSQNPDLSGGTLTVLTDPVDYTPQTGETLLIRRILPLTQQTDYPEGGEFPAQAHEDALDKLTRIAIQQQERLDRGAYLAKTSPTAGPLTLPEPVADYLLGWNSGGTDLENKAPGGGGGEANTASNIGSAGVGVFAGKSGVDLQFYKLNSLTAALSIALDAANSKVDFSVAIATKADAEAGTDNTKMMTALRTRDAMAVTLINDQTGTAYTLALSDAGKYVRLNNAAAITLTVPDNATVAFPVGTVIDIRQVGAGQVTVAGAAGVTVNTPETLKLRKQGSTASLIKVATDTWDILGDLELA